MPKRPAANTFAKDFAELERIAQKFEAGAFDVQEGLKDFEKGMALAQSLRERLHDVEQKVETIKAKYKAAGESAE